MFEYDIALSFAGEQRKQIEEIAQCLGAAGVEVFYDSFSKAQLWGKDLYQHLSDVYQKKARFCIIFVSKDYAEKAWTNHELKAAQARAFTEKGAEYILPVRFDDTEVAGVLPTIGFLDFRTEGTAGICAAALEKLGKVNVARSAGTSSAPAAVPLHCDSSPRALILSKELGVTLFPIISESSWGEVIDLSVEPEDRETDSVLTKFRAQKPGMLVAYGLDVAEAELLSAVRSTVRGAALWKLQFKAGKTDFRNDMEMGTSGMSADQFAEVRVRRLLLNEHLPQLGNSDGDNLAFMNNLMRENLIQGMNPTIAVKESLFPDLFRQLGSTPQSFLESAWISAVVGLKLSSAIEHIDYLRLRLSGTSLNVQFSGYRHRRYSNVDPYKIEVSGQLSLTQ
jgi:TIR domain